MTHIAIKIPVIESESGWGSKIDDHMVCLNVEDAINFMNEFNSKNDSSSVPDWYMYVENSPVKIELNDDQFNLLKTYGRVWLSTLKKLNKN